MSENEQITPYLILDVGGVLMEDAFPQIVDEICIWSERQNERRPDPQYILDQYRLRLRKDLWEGRIALDEFWHHLGDLAQTPLDPVLWNHRIQACRKPLPAFVELQRWAHSARIILLTNHRHEWLMPLLDAYGIRHHVSGIICSDLTGVMKPDSRAYAPAFALAMTPIMFVDDKAYNVEGAKKAAKEFGYNIATQVADPAGRWTQAVDAWLDQNSTS